MKNNFVAIIDGVGANLTSVQMALQRLQVASCITKDAQIIQAATHVILPGVGTAAHAMQVLKKQNLIAVIRNLSQPVLGICLGHQLLCANSAEDDTPCLNLIPLLVKKISAIQITPHMGWNNLVDRVAQDPLLFDISMAADFYFVHSFAAEFHPQYTIASCEYGSMFSAIIKNRNFYGVQFHPEKSSVIGLKLLENFLNLQ